MCAAFTPHDWPRNGHLRACEMRLHDLY
jgi:hypothetical protein